MSKKTRVAAFGAFVGVFLLAYTIGNTYKMSDEEAQTFLKDFQGATEGIDAVGIFVHNASVTLPMFVPGFGIPWGAFSGWQTGAAFTAMISGNPALEDFPPIAIFIVSPFGILELVAYSIGMSRSFILIRRIMKKSPLKKEIIPSAIEIGIAMAILLVAGFIEYSMISSQHVSL